MGRWEDRSPQPTRSVYPRAVAEPYGGGDVGSRNSHKNGKKFVSQEKYAKPSAFVILLNDLMNVRNEDLF